MVYLFLPALWGRTVELKKKKKESKIMNEEIKIQREVYSVSLFGFGGHIAVAMEDNGGFSF